VVEFRTFHNSDPPRLLKLWHTASLGPSAAEGFPCDLLELFVYARPYFDRRGLILATDRVEVVGMVHAGFSATADESRLDFKRGVISAVIVRPEYRRRGIGRVLVRQAEEFLKGHGARQVMAGAGNNGNGFYHALYGGVEPSGFAESGEHPSEFFAACGYEPGGVTRILHRDLHKGRDPVNARLIRNRRRLQMVITDRIPNQTWWWHARFGHQETLQFQLTDRSSGESVASGQILGLDVYIPKWGVRAVGMRDLFVPQHARRQGYAFSLVLEVCRELREQSIRLVETQVAADNTAALDLFASVRFEEVGTLLTFRRMLDCGG